MISGGQVHESLFLVIPQLNAAIARPFKEALKGLIGREPWFGLAAVLGLPPGGESAPSEPNSASVPVPPENELAAPAPETVLAAVSVVVCAMWLLSRRLSANYYGVASHRCVRRQENAGNGRAVLAFLRQALFALAGAVFKVLNGLFHAQGYIGELIEVFGQVAGKTLLLARPAASCSSLGRAPGVAQMP